MTGELTPDILLSAYRAGIFPMAESATDESIFWVDPKYRGIMPLNNFHVSKSLRRAILKLDYQISVNTSFKEVIKMCAERPETWINHDILTNYCLLHQIGHAHCLEVWSDKKLVGGIYGVSIGAVFFGESMFSKKNNASKIALAYLVDRLKATGFKLFDTQFLTPHLASLGAIEIPKTKYKVLLFQAVEETANFNSNDYSPDASAIAQRRAQTS
jgi:leucyl/phenylalanyl-tRNA--protein transferase